jgi:hypothetical protein
VSEFIKSFKTAEELMVLTNNNIKIVLPDVPFNCEKTLNYFKMILDNEITKQNPSVFAAVVQAKESNLDTTVSRCMDIYLSNNIPLIMIPIRLREMYYKYSGDVTEFILREFGEEVGKRIHQLGFSLQDVHSAAFWRCRSFDTTYPLKTLATNTGMGFGVKRPTNYFDLCFSPIEVRSQIMKFKMWLRTVGRDIELVVK